MEPDKLTDIAARNILNGLPQSALEMLERTLVNNIYVVYSTDTHYGLHPDVRYMFRARDRAELCARLMLVAPYSAAQEIGEHILDETKQDIKRLLEENIPFTIGNATPAMLADPYFMLTVRGTLIPGTSHDFADHVHKIIHNALLDKKQDYTTIADFIQDKHNVKRTT